MFLVPKLLNAKNYLKPKFGSVNAKSFLMFLMPKLFNAKNLLMFLVPKTIKWQKNFDAFCAKNYLMPKHCSMTKFDNKIWLI